jgi:membrane-associated HD superfamily phosphohydrolase
MDSGTHRHNSSAAALELLGAILLIATFLWTGRTWFTGALPVFASVLLLLTGSSHRRAGESARDIGFRLDTVWAAAAWLVPIVIVAIAVVLLISHRFGWLHPLSFAESARGLALFMASGLLQQYLLLGFFYRRCSEVLRSSDLAHLVTAAVFAVLHAPNMFLVWVTFAAGLASCAIYRRAPNLYVAGIAHGVLAHALFQFVPTHVTGGMQVGIEYLSR